MKTAKKSIQVAEIRKLRVNKIVIIIFTSALFLLANMNPGDRVFAQENSQTPMPAIEVIVAASPPSLEEPGGTVVFEVEIINNHMNTDQVTITVLEDDIRGDLNGQGTCSVPQIIPTGESYSCSFDAIITSTETSTVTASGTDDEGTPVSGTDDVIVTLADARQVSPPEYFSSTIIKLGDGTSLEKVTINGPPDPPPGFGLQRSSVSLPTPNLQFGTNSLIVPAYDWSFGCSATSAAMIAAYFDINGFPNIYTGPTNGGVMPLNNSVWPDWVDGCGATRAQNPLSATHLGLDGRVIKGGVDDYWTCYNSTADDPFIVGGWPEHNPVDSTGDFMFTNQSTYGLVDGATQFWGYDSNEKLYCSDLEDAGYPYNIDGTVGFKNFYQSRGYSVSECYYQKTDNEFSGGFSFEDYKAEIDAGQPVMIHVVGHTMVGVGYNDPSTVYLHDTWDYSTHSMIWGGSYLGMDHYAVSIVHLGTPEIDVQGNGQTIADGDSTPSGTDDTDFGGAEVGLDTVSHTFIIENTGNGVLSLDGSPIIEISGTHAADFSVTDWPITSVAASGGTTTFEITFDPSSGGLKEADVIISNNDNNEDPYNFSIQGAGVINSLPADDFIITVRTDNPGTSSNTQFSIPTDGGGYSYSVDCDDDGSDDAVGLTGNYTCDYPSAGTYTIRIKDITGVGNGFPRIFFNDEGDKDKLLTIEQWGTGHWTSMDRAFYGCSNLAGQASDAPDLSGVVSLRRMFRGASSFNHDIGNWDTSNVGAMDDMFWGASLFNQDIGSWDTSNVGAMMSTFRDTTTFNQNIGTWDTSNVQNMDMMFFNAASFNQDIGNWDTSMVQHSNYMFAGASQFNQDIGSWNTSNFQDMLNMFDGAISFNQDIGSWDTSNVETMMYTFRDAASFDQDIGSWNVEGVIGGTGEFIGMFNGAALSTANYDALLIGWDAQSAQSGLEFSGGNSTYCAGEAARANLISVDGWVISDGGKSCPEINVQGNGQSIVDGDATPSPTDDTDFGSIDWSSGTVGHIFTIENTGNGDLNLTASPEVQISGPNAAEFTVTSQPSSPITSGGGTTTFEITFDPSDVGLRTAEISIANDDSDENPYNYAIQGIGTAPCYQLSLNHDGDGSNPQAIPDNSIGCEEGYYNAGESIQLIDAVPSFWWMIGGWSGSDNDASTSSTNTLSMPDTDHSVSVIYEEIPLASTWYLAEGFSGNGASTFILIQNPSATNTNVKVQYMLQGGGSVFKDIVVAPNSRYTIAAHSPDQVGLDQAFSTKIGSDQKIIVERAMYWPNGPGTSGGHVTTGIQQPSNTWYLAEGFTGSGFQTFILIQNPNDIEAAIDVTYMLQGGGTIEKSLLVSPNSRFTIVTHDPDQVGLNQAFSTKLVSNQPIIVERAMYFNNDGHNTVGVEAPANSWYLAEGYTGSGFGTFILIQNPNSTESNVDIRYMLQGGGTIDKSVTVSANSRYTIVTHDADQVGIDQAFSTKIDSDQPIIVERAMYWPSGETSIGGHDSNGVLNPSLEWNIAEGYTGDDFDTFILVQNPNDTEANVSIIYMMQGGGTLNSDIIVPPNSRFTIVAHDPDQVGTGFAFSTNLVSDQPIIVERAMYFPNGGHNTKGVAE